MQTLEFSDKVAVITGASTGIGKACAKIMSDRGAKVVAVDINEQNLSWARDEPNIKSCVADISSEQGNDAMVALALAEFGRLDIAVFNAGIAGNGPLQRDSVARYDQIMAVNLRGVVLGMTAVIPALQKQTAAAMVVTASVSGLAGDPGMWAYNASKGGVVNLVRAAALDLASVGIRVNAVCPGPVRTAITADIESAAPEVFESLRSHVPMQRWGEAQELAEVIAFLASSKASFMTGAIVPVDGGVTANTSQFLPVQF